MQTHVRKLVTCALMTALVCAATMVVKIPSPLNGYLNLGDCLVLAAGWTLSPLYGFLAAGLGSALADLFAGYVTYAPATFLIKALMALIAHFGVRLLKNNCGKLPARLFSGFCAEVWMVGGYYLFEGLLYGFVPSLVNLLPNSVQGTVGLIVGLVFVKLFEKLKLFHT